MTAFFITSRFLFGSFELFDSIFDRLNEKEIVSLVALIDKIV